MKFKTGDVVIKKTGGNKMTICNFIDGKYSCFWFVGKHSHQGCFESNELVNLEEYKRILVMEERKDKIKNLME